VSTLSLYPSRCSPAATFELPQRRFPPRSANHPRILLPMSTSPPGPARVTERQPPLGEFVSKNSKTNVACNGRNVPIAAERNWLIGVFLRLRTNSELLSSDLSIDYRFINDKVESTNEMVGNSRLSRLSVSLFSGDMKNLNRHQDIDEDYTLWTHVRRKLGERINLRIVPLREKGQQLLH